MYKRQKTQRVSQNQIRKYILKGESDNPNLAELYKSSPQIKDVYKRQALMSQNKTLQHILDAVYRMAVRKQKANLERPEGRCV